MTTIRSTRISLCFNWDQLMGESNVAERTVSTSTLVHKKHTAEAKFCTGSKYAGEWDYLGMSGSGTYHFPYPVQYQGEMYDGMFHGQGTLIYPMGQKLSGTWDKGNLMEYQFLSRDNMPFSMESEYCIMPNRTYYEANHEDLQPAGMEFVHKVPGRVIDEKCYDVMYGFYNPETRSIRLAVDAVRTSFVDEDDDKDSSCMPFNDCIVVSDERAKWIEANCQKSWDEPVGYRPELYEYWMIGREDELDVALERIALGRISQPTQSQMYAGTGRVLRRSNE